MYRSRFPDDPGQHNPTDSFTRTTYTQNSSFCERVRQSLIAVVVGMALLTVASGLLFWNEGRVVQTAKSLQEGLDIVIPLQTAEVAFEQNNGKLVYVSGPIKTSNVLRDEEYGVELNVVKLRRKVEMYQWVEQEHTKTINEGERTRKETTYTYSHNWRGDVVRSSQFANPTGHHNPADMPVKSESYTASATLIGNFKLSAGMVGKISDFRKLHLNELPIQKPGLQVHGGMIYHGRNPLQPEVGDLRVLFEYAGVSEAKLSNTLGEPNIVSVIGKQEGHTLTEYQTEAGDKLDLLHMGSITAEKMIAREQAQNTFLCWALRLAGWLLMFIGFGCLTRIIVTSVDWIPIIRDLVNLGVMTLNFTLAISWSLTVIALGWIWYRPWLGIFLLMLASLPFLLSRRRAVNATNRRTYYQASERAQHDW